MTASTITAKGQVTIPKEVRDQLGVKPGDKVKIYRDYKGRFFMIPVVPVTALRGIASGRRKKPLTIEEMNEAAIQGAIASAMPRERPDSKPPRKRR